MRKVIGPNNAQSEKKMPIPKSRNRKSLTAERSMTRLPVRDFLGLRRGRMRRLATTRQASHMNPRIRMVQPKPTEMKSRRIAMGKTIPVNEPLAKVTPQASPR